MDRKKALAIFKIIVELDEIADFFEEAEEDGGLPYTHEDVRKAAAYIRKNLK